jgi:hypothetical protein
LKVTGIAAMARASVPALAPAKQARIQVPWVIVGPPFELGISTTFAVFQLFTVVAIRVFVNRGPVSAA